MTLFVDDQQIGESELFARTPGSSDVTQLTDIARTNQSKCRESSLAYTAPDCDPYFHASSHLTGGESQLIDGQSRVSNLGQEVSNDDMS